MKQTLQLKISQQLSLTPQLQQSIRLLQLSTHELHQEIERIVQENPMLELVDSPNNWETSVEEHVESVSSGSSETEKDTAGSTLVENESTENIDRDRNSDDFRHMIHIVVGVKTVTRIEKVSN